MRRFLFLLIVLAVAIGTYTYFTDIAEAPGTPSDRRVDVEGHIRENIAQLSPEPAVLGGTFYVTQIEAADGRGMVWYEDGHVAFVADFEYVEDKYGVTIQSFEVRSE